MVVTGLFAQCHGIGSLFAAGNCVVRVHCNKWGILDVSI